MNKRQEGNQEAITRTDFSRGEAALGLFWLALAALVSVLLEVMYLGTWITLPGGAKVAFPYMIAVAFLFNRVLSRTALLWTRNAAIAGIPLWTWLAGYVALTMWVAVSGDQLVGNNIRSVALLIAGMIGGGWPLVLRR
ncbi:MULTISPECIES: hypothetical protein [unclassified Corynebacterium]|uniref:hypothetical protein n=1 Tax=unclassified Corynebacterium TaxID=2624378 RepID=UPI0029C9F456|nr:MULTISPECIES: hypothetical protein [unclassified Corynebacterium]WPF66954.1 hypothetical protein OLX12_04305 [Corynebacterium sp. 22KM0430]WPF69442.1 hypothetical protein OLW90_04300 [Corynebacterium sp. 21KM1197]